MVLGELGAVCLLHLLSYSEHFTSYTLVTKWVDCPHTEQFLRHQLGVLQFSTIVTLPRDRVRSHRLRAQKPKTALSPEPCQMSGSSPPVLLTNRL